jgi:methylenetetrahydrofolate reductase (NADPH)
MDVDSLSPISRKAITHLLEDPIFEIIPLSNAPGQAEHLPPGARISITASPNKTLEDSLDLAEVLVDRGFRVTPHLSARMTIDLTHLERLLTRILAIGLDTAFVVGGDGEYSGAFYDGLDLLVGMERIGHGLKVGVPCYPEGHPKIPDEQLTAALVAKQRHAAWMTSQMCFDASALVNWANAARVAGVDLPLVLGLPGVADRLKLLAISARIGVGRSLSFLRKSTGLVSAFVKPGGYDPAELLIDLGEGLNDERLDVVGCHIYTFNQCDTTEAWRQSFLASL